MISSICTHKNKQQKTQKTNNNNSKTLTPRSKTLAFDDDNGGSLEKVHVPLWDRLTDLTRVYSAVEVPGQKHSLVPSTQNPLTCTNWQTRCGAVADGLSTLMVLNRLRDDLHWLLMLNSTFSVALSSIVTVLLCPR